MFNMVDTMNLLKDVILHIWYKFYAILELPSVAHWLYPRLLGFPNWFDFFVLAWMSVHDTGKIPLKIDCVAQDQHFCYHLVWFVHRVSFIAAVYCCLSFCLMYC